MADCGTRVHWKKDLDVYNGDVHSLASFGLVYRWIYDRLAIFSTDIVFDLQTIEDLETALEADYVESQERTR